MSQSTLNEDWLKSLTWDLWRVDTLITTVPDLLWALRVSEAPLVEQQAAIQKFTKNPSWIPAPQELKDAVAVFLASGEIQKGDLPGHPFHGNQWQTVNEYDSKQDHELAQDEAAKWTLQHVTGTVEGYFSEGVEGAEGHDFNGMTHEEASAVREYGGDKFRTVNRALRKEGFEIGFSKSNPLIEQVQNAINKSTTDQTISVYRGIHSPRGTGNDLDLVKQFAELKPGDTFSDKAFVSTSLLMVQAERFAAIDGAVVNITIPEGSHAVGILGREGEILLGAGSTFRLDQIQQNDEGKPVYHMTYIGSDPYQKGTLTKSRSAGGETSDKFVWGAGDIVFTPKPITSADITASTLPMQFGKAVNLLTTAEIAKGDLKGHPFHGNQWRDGEGSASVSPELRQQIRDFAEAIVPKQFVETYTSNLSKILANPKEYERLRAKFAADGDKTFGGPDMKAIFALSGTNGVPKVVSNSAFSKIPSPVLYQGIHSGEGSILGNRPNAGVTAENMAANFAYNPTPYIGSGDYGIAYYTSQEPSVAGRYANHEDNAMLRMKLSPDATTMTFDQAERSFELQQDGMKQLLENAGFKNFDVEHPPLKENPTDTEWREWQSLGRETSWFLCITNTTALLSGVAALTRDDTPYGQYTMVLDRSKVAVSDTYTKIDPSYWGTAGVTTAGVYEIPSLANKDFGEKGATGKNPLIANIKIDQALTKAFITKGDKPGHPFRGNQWKDGEGENESLDKP